MSIDRKYQRGVTLTGLIIGGVIISMVAVLGMKVGPEVVNYLKVVAAIKAVANEPAMSSASVSEVRNAYERRAIVDHVDEVVGKKELEVTKDGGRLVISFAYAKQIPLFGPVSLLIDFVGNSAK